MVFVVAATVTLLVHLRLLVVLLLSGATFAASAVCIVHCRHAEDGVGHAVTTHPADTIGVLGWLLRRPKEVVVIAKHGEHVVLHGR